MNENNRQFLNKQKAGKVIVFFHFFSFLLLSLYPSIKWKSSVSQLTLIFFLPFLVFAPFKRNENIRKKRCYLHKTWNGKWWNKWTGKKNNNFFLLITFIGEKFKYKMKQFCLLQSWKIQIKLLTMITMWIWLIARFVCFQCNASILG